MYPANFFGLFPPFPRTNNVFVAMSFAPRFSARWERVISPAVRDVRVNDIPLNPVRVDARTISDSILTEILDGVANSAIVLADVTSVGEIDARPVRNANVMYEVGLAHAARLPEEVLLFRSDDGPILFDIANVRVNRYNPDDDPDVARAQVRDALLDALREVDTKRHLAVRKVAESLDYASWSLLAEAYTQNGVIYPPTRTMRQVVGSTDRRSAIARLLELGVLRTEYLQMTPETVEQDVGTPAEALLKYKCTPFGEAIFNETAERFGLSNPDVAKILEERISNSGAEK